MQKLLLHDIHREEGARFIEYAGWELPLMYVSIIAEHQQVRMSVGMTDISFMGKLEVAGSDARKLLERHSTRSLGNARAGRALYSLMLTAEAGIFADMMIFVRENSYLLTLNPLTAGKVLKRLQEDSKDLDVSVADKTGSLALISLQGRRAYMTLQRLTDAVLSDIGHNRFCKAFVIGEKAFVSRTSYTGEDGFEIFIDSGFASELWYELREAGQAERLVPAGVGARSTLRLEAAYPLYGKELSEDVNPIEADLAFAANSKADYLGAERLEKIRRQGVKRKLCALVVNSRVVARDGFEVYAGGEKVGHITRGVFGPTIKKNIALAYLPVEMSVPGSELEVVVRGKKYPAVVTRKPFYIRKRPVVRM